MDIYYYLAAFLFSLGLVGSMTKKDLVSILLCIELMLAAVSLMFVLFSKMNGSLNGQIMVIFIMIVAAAEAAIGLSLVVTLFRKIRSAYRSDVQIYSE